MNPASQREWKNQALDFLWTCLAQHEPVNQLLVYRGARVLARILPLRRASLDLDATFRKPADASDQVAPTPDSLASVLAHALDLGIRRTPQCTYRREKPVRVDLKPPAGHPMGWTAYVATVSLRDVRHLEVGDRLPTLKLDIAAPEDLSPSSVMPLNVGGYSVFAYTKERLLAEKLRAFLSSLPDHRSVHGGGERAIRTKDLHDVALLAASDDHCDSIDWHRVREEFESACRSRNVDPALLTADRVAELRNLYEVAIDYADMPFDEMQQRLRSIIRRVRAVP